MSVVFNWPQYVWLALIVITFLITVYQASTRYTAIKRYDFGDVVLSIIVSGFAFWLLMSGGFFAGCH